jgi:phosphoserine phosphatase
VLFDLDGTLTVPRSSWKHIHEALGLWDGQASRHQERFRSGEISYEEFCRLDAEEWRGLSVARLRSICDAIPYHEGAPDLVAALRRSGLRIGIVSTGLTLLAERVRLELGLDHAVANDLVEREGRVTGEVTIRVAHGQKHAALAAFCEAFRIPADQVAAVGDTEGDVSLFSAAAWSIAFNPADLEVRRAAAAVARTTDLRELIPLLIG